MTRKGRPLANGSDRRRAEIVDSLASTNTHARTRTHIITIACTIIIEWHLHVYNIMHV